MGEISIKGKSSQYAYTLAILCGGLAFFVAQFGMSGFALYLTYMLLAALFCFIWPDKALEWTCWLFLPAVLLLIIDFFTTGFRAGILRDGPILIRAVPSACVGAFIGAKLSLQIHKGYALEHGHRHHPRRKESSLPNDFLWKEPAALPAKGRPSTPIAKPTTLMRAFDAVAQRKDLDASLIKAVQEGNLNQVRALIADGADVNTESADKWTPLMIAALDGEREMMEALFGAGASSSAGGDTGWTPLMIATIEGHMEVVHALLEHGADANVRDDKGWTALRFSVSMNETKILRALMEAGADVNSTDNKGRTALMQAAEEGILDCVKALLDAGANPHLRDEKGQTALLMARRQGHTNIISLLKEAEAKTPTEIDAENILATDYSSCFYRIKEELEEGLNNHHGAHETNEAVSRMLSALQTLKEQIDAVERERLLAPSELSHKLMLTLKEAAVLACLPRQHLLEAIKNRRLKAQLTKNIWRIKREDLDSFIRTLN